MKKLIIISILCSLLIWQSIQMITTILADKELDYEQYAHLAEKETGLQIEEVQRFHGDQLFYVFKATDLEENNFFVFVNEDMDIWEIEMKQIELTKKEAVALALTEDEKLQKVSRVTPSITGNHFTWEVVGIDQDDHLRYIYYSMQDGTFQKRYILSN